MFIHYRTKGIVLKKVDRRESDQLFIVYTQDFGKVEILGKSIRKISSKLRSGMEMFSLTEIEFIQGKAYKTLTDAFLIEKLKDLKKNLEKLTVATEIADVLDELIKGQEPDDGIWELLSDSFKELNSINAKDINPKLLYFYFFWNFLSILGYTPELYKCVLCGDKLNPEKLYFSPKDGGIICAKCFLKEKFGNEASQQIVKILRIFIKKDKGTLFRLNFKKAHFKELEEVSKNYFDFISEQIN